MGWPAHLPIVGGGGVSYDMEPGSKNLSIAIGFIGKTTNALSLKCMMEFDDIVKTFGSKTVNMIEAKPLEINYLLGREWELPQINKPETKYPTSSSIYHNKDGSASITFGNYRTIKTVHHKNILKFFFKLN